MKKNQTARSLGAVLVAVGFLCLVVFLVGLLTYGSADPNQFLVNDETRQAEISAKETTSARYRSLLSARCDQVVAYYTKLGYEDRVKIFSDLKAELAAGGAISDETNRSIQGLRSVDGLDDEVQHLYNAQNLISLIRSDESGADRLRAALGTDQGVAAGNRRAFLARISVSAWLLLIAGSLVLVTLGFVLNHGYGMRKVLSRVALYALLILGGVIMVFPFYWMLSSSLKTRIEVSMFPPQFIPGNWLNFENYRLAFNTAPFAQYFLNSIVVCFFSVLIVTVTTILASFAFSRLKFPGRELIFSALLSMMMLPFEMLVITNYSTVIHLGFNDSLPALVFPFISSIFYTYIMRNFFMSIPDSLYWSARVDGCSNWRYLWKVMVPIARPSLVTVVLLNALASWNSFMWPLLVIKSTVNRTLPFGLYAFTTEAGSYQELIMAASTIVVLPMIILFLFCRKQILNGVARGGIKG